MSVKNKSLELSLSLCVYKESSNGSLLSLLKIGSWDPDGSLWGPGHPVHTFRLYLARYCNGSPTPIRHAFSDNVAFGGLQSAKTLYRSALFGQWNFSCPSSSSSLHQSLFLLFLRHGWDALCRPISHLQASYHFHNLNLKVALLYLDLPLHSLVFIRHLTGYPPQSLAWHSISEPLSANPWEMRLAV